MAARLSRHSSATLAGVLLCLALGAVPVLAQEAGAPPRGGAAVLRREARRERLTALPPVRRAEELRRLGEGLEAEGELRAAAQAYERALALDPGNAAAREDLARVEAASTGTVPGAPAAAAGADATAASAADAPQPTPDASLPAANDAPPELAPESAAEAVPAAEPAPAPTPELVGGTGDPSSGAAPGAAPAWPPAPTDASAPGPARATPLLLLLALAAGALALVRALRGTGDLVVGIGYPAELKGSFHIRVSRRPAPRPAAGRPTETRSQDGVALAPTATRTERFLVTREAQFQGLPARDCFVVLEGVLQDAGGGAGELRFEQKRVRVVRGRTVRVDFDLRPTRCAVELVALEQGRPLARLRGGRRGEPAALRYTRGSSLALSLPPGRHALVVAGAEALAEREIEIRGFEPIRLQVDLAREEEALFSGCAEAVEAYLAGNLEACARALAASGHVVPAERVRARLHRERGQHAEAAAAFEAAGERLEAARSHVAAGARERALALLEPLFAGSAAEEAPLDTLEWYAALLEEEGCFGPALAVLETVRSRELGRPHVSSRIEALRKRASAERALAAPGSPPAPFGSDGRYEILEQVGAGGMGVVFRARDTRLDRIVALKRLPESLRDHPRAVELFLREARSAARLNHPNLVTIHDVDQEDGRYFITMEFLEGQPLAVLLRQRGRFRPRTVQRLGLQAAAGLQYAHENRIVHRDVKTSNLFLTRDRTLKIMDFGLAKVLEEVRRASTIVGGTPYYMAPEQSLGLAVDGRADLYALGVTFFELLTGSLPFTTGDVAYHHRHTPPPDPRERAPGLPERFARLVLEMLAKEPEARPASAGVVTARLRELDSVLAGPA